MKTRAPCLKKSYSLLERDYEALHAFIGWFDNQWADVVKAVPLVSSDDDESAQLNKATDARRAQAWRTKVHDRIAKHIRSLDKQYTKKGGGDEDAYANIVRLWLELSAVPLKNPAHAWNTMLSKPELCIQAQEGYVNGCRFRVNRRPLGDIYKLGDIDIRVFHAKERLDMLCSDHNDWRDCPCNEPPPIELSSSSSPAVAQQNTEERGPAGQHARGAK